jgi:molecular chaperone DnaK (HSP70)
MALLRVKKESNTYNPNYPGLNKASYDKMVSAVNKLNIPEEDKEAAMNQWYRNNVKYLLNDQTLDERATEINKQAYQAAEAKSPEANAQLRMTEFSQALKKKYNLDATANDLDVFNTYVENLGEDGVNLA